MRTSEPRRRLGTRLVLLVLLPFAAARLEAQSTVADDWPSGEQYRVEVAAPFWRPHANVTIASDGRGIRGVDIDLRGDLGLTDQGFWGIRCVVRPAPRHKLRFEYLPIGYESSATLPRDVIFNGIRYPQGTAVSSTFHWTSYRVDYEYALIARRWGYVGVIVEGRGTIISERLNGPAGDESRRASIPIPAGGGVVRFYPGERWSLTAELTGLKVPNNAEKTYGGYYADFEAYGIANLTAHLGAQIGFRSIHIGHYGEADAASIATQGLYVGGVARY